jgi:hypothetical protein
MVLVSDKPSNDIDILQTKLGNREGHEPRRVGLEAMPLGQDIEGGHGERGLCRKFAFETICAMVSPGNLRCAERENDDGDQFQGSPFSAGYYSDGGAVVGRLSLELPACRRAHAGTRRAG